MSDERFELQVATVSGKYPGETSSNTLTFAYSTDASNRIMDYSLFKAEGYSKRLTVQLRNRDGELVGGTYSAALGTGNLVTGLQVDFYDYPTSTGAKTLQFHGKIAEVSQEEAGLIEIFCVSELAAIEELYREAYYADTYREEYQVAQRELAWPIALDGDADWVSPPLMAEAVIKKEQGIFAEIVIADGYYQMLAVDTIFSQPFPNRSNWVSMMYMKMKGGPTNTATIRVSIQKIDVATGFPDGVNVCYQDFGPYTDDTDKFNYFTPDLDTVGHPLVWADKFDTNQGYAVIIRPVGVTTTVDISVGTVAAGWNLHAQASVGGVFAEQTFSLAPFMVWYSEWTDMDLDEAYDAPVGNIGFSGVKMRDKAPDGDSSVHIARGCATYFYGTVDVHLIMENLISFGCASAFVDPAGGSAVGIYRTSGKSMIECLHQLCDRFSVGSVRTQATVFDNYNASTHAASVYVLDKYNTTTDSAVATFTDTEADDTRRIVASALKKDSALKINTVEVVGESNKKPVFAQSVDWASRAEIGPVVYKVSDKNIASYSECRSEAQRIKDSLNRTDWEGEITVHGCYSDLVDMTAGTTGQVRGGNIVELTISTLHVSAQKFKVRSVTTTPGKTVIAVTSYDFTKEQDIELRSSRSLMAENFVADLDALKEIYVPVREASAFTTATVYMVLATADGIALPGQTRVLCTKTADGIYNVYHATFEPMNAWTVSGTKCGRIVFYAAASGGSSIQDTILTDAEQFYKLKVSRVSVDAFFNQT